MSRAVITAFHKYQPYGDEYYHPILEYYLTCRLNWIKEVDNMYLIDSNWGLIRPPTDKYEVLRVNSSLRYYDAYKQTLPLIKEDMVLFLDNDMVIYREGIVEKAFKILEDREADIVTIYDTIGEYKTDKLGGKNKFCPYFFATRKELLMEYRDIDWAPDMPYCETLGHLTEAMLDDGFKSYEFEEDKSNILFDGTKDGEKSKDLGYYHIRAGSTAAVLLAWRDEDEDQYFKYISEQPKSEYLRHMAWYWIMGGDEYIDRAVLQEMGVNDVEWLEYIEKFRKYHGLK